MSSPSDTLTETHLMNDRARALAILREARDLLAQRLTDRVLDAAEEILADARGDSYMGDIDTIYEQVGMRMVHLNQMITHLPTEEEPAPEVGAPPPPAQDYFTVATETAPSADAVSADTTPALVGPVYISTPALPAPATPTDGLTESPITFQLFATQVYAGNLPAAGRSLAILFGMSENRGQRCAAHFAERMQHDPQFLRKAAQLRSELHDGGEHGALVLLHQCFGLAGLDAVSVLDYLRQQAAE